MTERTDPPTASRMPVIFLAHGSPMLLDDARWTAELAAWSGELPRPRAVLVLSAHWVDAPIAFGATRTVPLVYDFYGFPKRYYELTYPAPGAPDLATRVRALLADRGQAVVHSDRGLDHGAYVPLVAMLPRADVPVLQLSLPTLEPGSLVKLGQALAPLRDEGVLVVGSGFVTHNLGALDPRTGAVPPSWASEFDAWVADVLERGDLDALLDYRRRGPGVREALPTHEHFVPLLVTVGAADFGRDPLSFPITGFTYGSFTKRSVQLG